MSSALYEKGRALIEGAQIEDKFYFEPFLLSRGFKRVAGEVSKFMPEFTRAFERGPVMVVVTVLDLGHEQLCYMSAGLSDMAVPPIRGRELPKDEVAADRLLNSLSALSKKAANGQLVQRRRLPRRLPVVWKSRRS